MDPVTLRVTGEVTSALASVANLRDQWLQFAASYQKSAKEVGAALNNFSGDRVIREATTYAKVVQEIGGVSRLTTAEQAQLNRVVTEAIEKYRALGRQAPSDLLAIQDATKGATQNSGGFFDTLFFKIAGGVTAGTILANGLLAAFDMIKDGIVKLGEGFAYMVERGSKVSNITIGFENLTAGIGQYAGPVLDQARAKTLGLITDFDLMQAANRAMLFGLDLSEGKFGTLGEAAIKLGRAMGMEAGKSLDDLVLALGRVSPRILDNLGIIVKVGEANTIWAKENGKTVKEMTAQERVTAFTNLALIKMNEHLGKMGDVHLTLADKVLIVRNQFTNFIDNLSVATVKSGVLNTAMNEIMKALSSAFGQNNQQLITTTVNLIEQLAIWFVKATQLGVDFAINIRKAYADITIIGAELTRGIVAIATALVDTSVQLLKVQSAFQPWNLVVADQLKQAQEWSGTLHNLRDQTTEHVRVAYEMRKGEDSVGKALAATSGWLEELAKKLEEAKGKSVEWTKQSVTAKKAVDDESDSIEKSADKRKTLSQRLAELNSDLLKIAPSQASVNLVTKEYGSTIEDLVNKANLSKTAIPAAVKAWADAINKNNLAKLLGQVSELVSKGTMDFEKWLQDGAEAWEKQIDQAKKAYERLDDAHRNFTNRLNVAQKSGIDKRLAEIERERQEAIDKLGPRPEDNVILTQKWDATLVSLEEFFKNAADTAIYENKRALNDAKRTWSDDFIAVVAEVPKLLQDAFTGGGGWEGARTAIAAKMGETIGGRAVEGVLSGVFNNLSGWMADTFGAKTTASIGKAIPGISKALGSLMGAAADAVLGKMTQSTNAAVSTLGTAGQWAMAGAAFGPYGAAVGAAAGAIVGFIKSANDGRKAVEDFAKASGGFDAMHQKLLTLGAAGEELWVKLTQGTAKGDAVGAQKLIAEIKDKLAAAEAQTKSWNESLSTLASSIAGWGESLPAEVQPYIDQLIKAGKLTKENADALKAFGSEGTVNFEQLKGLAEKYGIELDALGPRFRAAEMSSTAGQIIKDFEMMLSNGADMNGLLHGMADEISTVAQHSIKFGTEIPGNMRPWIEQLMASGELLDENGNKITDISKLHFGDDIKVGLDAIVSKLQEMIDLMANKVGGAVTTVASRLTDNQRYWLEWERQARGSIDEVREGVDGISFGSSPGGLKEIPLKLAEGLSRMKTFSREATSELRRVRNAVDDIGLVGMDNIVADVSYSNARITAANRLANQSLQITNHIDAQGAIFYRDETLNEMAEEIGNRLAEQYFIRNPQSSNLGGR